MKETTMEKDKNPGYNIDENHVYILFLLNQLASKKNIQRIHRTLVFWQGKPSPWSLHETHQLVEKSSRTPCVNRSRELQTKETSKLHRVSAMGSTTTPLPVKLKLAMPGKLRYGSYGSWMATIVQNGPNQDV